jgi:hypothetical protein
VYTAVSSSTAHSTIAHHAACDPKRKATAYSLALTDHYFAVDILEQISASMLGGKPRPALPQDQEKFLRGMVKGVAGKFGKRSSRNG